MKYLQLSKVYVSFLPSLSLQSAIQYINMSFPWFSILIVKPPICVPTLSIIGWLYIFLPVLPSIMIVWNHIFLSQLKLETTTAT